MSHSSIHIEGARQHNLKNLSLDIPRDELVVVCGPSGSGKSTLAFDIVYAEGQRRYVESLSAYARQFLPQMDKPDVDKIEGLSPAISLEQQTTGRNPRSTVGTVTEVYDFLRVFFARLGKMYCPQCGRPIEARAADEIIADILALPEGTKVIIMAPLVELQKGTHLDRFKKLKAEGFVRVRVDGQLYGMEDIPALDKNKKHTIDLVIDRLVIKDGIRGRLADSVELALRYGEGRIIVNEPDKGADGDTLHATESVCPVCKISLPAPSPQLFSFNSPQGACPRCAGLGTVEYFEPMLIAPNRGLSLNTKAILPWANPKTFARYEEALTALGKRFGFTLSTPLSAYSPEALQALFYGEDDPSQKSKSGLRRNRLGGSVALESPEYDDNAPAPVKAYDGPYKLATDNWPGVIPLLERGMQYGDMWRDLLSRYLQSMDCPTCHGARLRPESLAVRVDDLNIHQFCSLPVERALRWLNGREFDGRHALVAEPLLKELNHRLSFMTNVGLDYISLGRTMTTLSGGESQRIRLASQLGSGLVGVTYVLDEPSIGLHPRDNERLIATLRSLQGRGNTVLVVEHDEATIREADHIIELGPGSGAHGGDMVYHGSFENLIKHSETLTAKYMRGDLSVPIPDERREPKGWLTLRGVTTNNLKDIDCPIPLGTLTCVTGVSGSGKSSFVNEILYKKLAAELNGAKTRAGAHDEFIGIENLDKVIDIDQSPIGRTPRSNPATYVGVFTPIRELFAQTPESKAKGYKSGRFSFNTKGGRCEACSGDGIKKIEMHFLPDIYVPCEVCKGKRYNRETLDVRYKGKNIADVLDMTIEYAAEFFSEVPVIKRKIDTLNEVGLGYMKLGQPSTTLSGGEAQRVKLAEELSRVGTGKTLYILDEPTTGLHTDDVRKLVEILQRLVDGGNTVVVIEHNLDVIKSADHIIDLGPDGGDKGGTIVACGTPEEVSRCESSYTGQYLKKVLMRK